ncbi:EXLDI protein [Nocardia sp. BMG51109]|uniref:EXLDI protein n=1 Tax=Nocardia sp. BMG51109 TaxID=1056816 RepID=UPI000467A123|nr:EXLDI protein [Nocardia sp. BMG51109]
MMTTDPQNPDVLDERPAEGNRIDLVGVEYGEIVLRDGPGGVLRKRFEGRHLAEVREITKAGIEATRVYRSRKGKFVIQRQQADWSDLSTLTSLSDWRNWRSALGVGEQNWGDFSVQVVDSLDELRVAIAPKLYRRVAAAVQQPRTEDLDI